MKKIILICAALVTLGACKPADNISPAETAAEPPAVKTMANLSLTPLMSSEVMLQVNDVMTADSNSIVYTITNNSGQSLTFGDNVKLYHNYNGNWSEIELADDSTWFELGNVLESNAASTGSIDLGDLVETLPEGAYLLERYMYSDNEPIKLSAEFNINHAK